MSLPAPPLAIGSLLLTIGVEWAVLGALLRRSWRSLLPLVALVNAATQPVATWLVTALAWPFWAVEGGVCAVEAALLAGLLGVGWRRAALLACLANGMSAGLGLLLFR